MERVVILGNAGAGKTTLARRLARERGHAVLSLDAIAFVEGTPERRALADSAPELRAFTEAHPRWVVEGCHADLAARALERATLLVWLDPGLERCLAHCRARPFEPDKFASPSEQDAVLEVLFEFVRGYGERDDETSRAAHARLFEAFGGASVRLEDPAAIERLERAAGA